MAETARPVVSNIAHFNSFIAGTGIQSAIWLDGKQVKPPASGNTQVIHYYSHSRTGVINQLPPTD